MLVYLTSLTVFSGDLKKKKGSEKKKKKKKKLWKWPVNWSFSELFYSFFFRPPDPRSEKKIP